MNKKLLIAATKSGSGKTTVTCGLLQIFKNRGLTTAAFKCGPDYIDPLFHQAITNLPSRNLDLFFMSEESANELLHRQTADIAVLEGAMGFYDGIGFTDQASAYHVAKAVSAPVLLVVDAKGMGRSLLAHIKGFLTYADAPIQGIVLNRVSPHWYGQCKKCIEEELHCHVFGYLPEKEAFALKSRHLGLLRPEEVVDFQQRISLLADAMEETIEVDGILNLAWGQETTETKREDAPQAKPRCRVGIARDAAFCFYYEENLELLHQCGCETVFFSPMGEELPEGLDGLWLGGGYPEVHAALLAENESMRGAIREALDAGMPCIAEGGGYFYLHKTLEDAEGKSYPMVGALSGAVQRGEALHHFGYVTLTAQNDGLFCQKGEQIRGHEFHYWNSSRQDHCFEAKKPTGNKCYLTGVHRNTLYAACPQIHFYANPKFAHRFAEKCYEYHKLRESSPQ